MLDFHGYFQIPNPTYPFWPGTTKRNEQLLNENIRRKKNRKSPKHFDILINDKKVKIVGYRIKDYKSKIESGRIIELISQQKFDKADRGEVIIKIDTVKQKLEISGNYKFSWNREGKYGIAYWINDLKER